MLAIVQTWVLVAGANPRIFAAKTELILLIGVTLSESGAVYTSPAVSNVLPEGRGQRR